MSNGNFSKRLLDSIGQTYGEYRVIAPFCNESKGKDSYRYVKAECSCGNIRVVRVDSLWRGDAKSCGCRRGISCGVKFPVTRVSDHPLYSVWTGMNRRCYTKTRKDYKHYGGRGIGVCERWRRDSKNGFLNFLEDMEESFENGLELERLDTNGDYTVTNCKWTNRKSQVNNTRVNRLLSGYGVSLSIEEWNFLLGIDKGLLWDRAIALGWGLCVEKLLSTPLKDRCWKFEYKNSIYNAGELWETLGYSHSEVCRLVREHGNSEEALIAERVKFKTIKPREKSYRSFEEGLEFLRGSNGFYEKELLVKIKKQLEEV